jgi:hypothetical protein
MTEDLATTTKELMVRLDENGVPYIRDGNVVTWYERIGPARAEQILKTYKVDYRKYRESYGQGLARDMVNGYWNFDGSPVRIDINGNLFDGSHRQHAIVLSGTTQLFLMIAGLPVEAYNTADTGLARNYGDTLRRRGFQNANARTALVKLIRRWEDGRSLDDTQRYTPSELDETHDKYVDTISRAVAKTMSTQRKVDMPGALVSFSWWKLSQLDIADAQTFLIGLAEGENIRRGMPVYTLRERLNRERDTKLTRMQFMHLVFEAWNAFRTVLPNGEREQIHRLTIPAGITIPRIKLIEPK